MPENHPSDLDNQQSVKTTHEAISTNALHADISTLERILQKPQRELSFSNDGECQKIVRLVEQIGATPLASEENKSLGADATNERLGQYELLTKVGEGGMGAVYKALHTKLNKLVALKVLPADRLEDQHAVTRFEREMRAVGQLNHANIVAAHDAGEIDGNHYLVMELVDGVDLSTLVRRCGTLPLPAACKMICLAAEGLQHAHNSGMVHRDIKPGNLMLTFDGHVKILDMGLALLDELKSPEKDELTTTGQMMGTLDYMAPEQGNDSHQVDIRADVYSLGATLFKLLTGEPPFHGPKYKTPVSKMMALAVETPRTLAEVRDDIPSELSQVVARMLAKEPDERPATPQEVIDLLAPFAEGAPLEEVARIAKDKVETEIETDAPSGDTFAHLRSSFTETCPTIAVSPAAQSYRRRSRGRRRLRDHFGSLPPSGRIAVALGAAAMAGLLLLGVILTLRTDQGTIIVTVPEGEENNIEISVRHGGKEVNVLDADKGWTIKIKEGKYELDLKKGSDRFAIDDGTLTVSRGERMRARVKLTKKTGSGAKDASVQKIADKAKMSPLESSSYGLLGEYFKGMNFQKFIVARVDPQINFKWAHSGAGSAPAPNVDRDVFSVRWTGQLIVPKSGNYQIAFESDDGGRMWLDGKQRIDNWNHCGNAATDESDLMLAKGSHPIRIEFQDKYSLAIARLSWRLPGEKEFNIIPAVNLRPPMVHPSFPKDGTYVRFVNRLSELCLAVHNGLTKNGARMSQERVTEGDHSQQWLHEDAGSGYFRLKNRKSGLYLTFDEAKQGEKFTQWTLRDVDDAFLWKFETIRGEFGKIINKKNKLCMAIWGSDTKAGQYVIQWPYSEGKSDHYWRIEPVKDTNGSAKPNTLKSQHSPTSTVVKLTELEPVTAKAGFRGYQATTNGNGPLLRPDVKAAKQYLFAPAPSHIRYAVPKGMKSFTAVAFAPSYWTVAFKVMVGDETLYEYSKDGRDTIRIDLPTDADAIDLFFIWNHPKDRGSAFWVAPRFHPVPVVEVKNLFDEQGDHVSLTGMNPLLVETEGTELLVNRVPEVVAPPVALDLAYKIVGHIPADAPEKCKEYIYANPESRAEYAIPPGATAFSAVGHSLNGRVIFEVYGDKTMLYRSPGAGIIPIKVDIPKGASVLTLVVTGSRFRSESFWCYPRFHIGESAVPSSVSLPTKETIDEKKAWVVTELKRLNPQFSGSIDTSKSGDHIAKLGISRQPIADISPLSELKHLQTCNLTFTRLKNLEPLRGLPIRSMDLNGTPVNDLSALADCPIEKLSVSSKEIGDDQISVLRKTPIKELGLTGTSISGFQVFRGWPLKNIHYANTGRVKDLSALAGMPLEELAIHRTPVDDLTSLKGMPIRRLEIEGTKVSDLSPLAGMPLKVLHIDGTQVTDLSPLITTTLEDLRCDLNLERDVPILRQIKTLKTINGKPVAEVFEAPVEKKAVPDEKSTSLREWTDKTGRFTVQAELVSVEGDIARLKKSDDGQLVTLPLSRLSDTDQAFARKWLTRSQSSN